MKYNIIGDIHGRTIWNDLVINDATNIFVGDYFDPYDDYSFEEQLTNFLDIIYFAKNHPGTILLFGNHDLHYFHGRDHSRFNYQHALEIRDVFLDNIHMFNVAFSIEDKILVTHAGVTSEWLEMTEFAGSPTPNCIADHINYLLWDGYTEVTDGKVWSRHFDICPDRGMDFFTFNKCADYFDSSGTTPTQSPVWIRPQTLVNHNPLENFVQVVGHTQVKKIAKIPYPIWLVDCLGSVPESLLIDTDETTMNFTINEPRQE